MKDKIKKILEFLRIDEQHKRSAGVAIKNMIEALKINDMAEYSKFEDALFNFMGVNVVVESKDFTAADVQNLHDKIKYICGYVINENVSEDTSLYDYYYRSGQVTRDIQKIKADDFKWDNLTESKRKVEKISKDQFKWSNEESMPDVSGDRKKKVVYYDSERMMYNGQTVTAELIMKMLKMGIILMPNSVNKERHGSKRIKNKMI